MPHSTKAKTWVSKRKKRPAYQAHLAPSVKPFLRTGDRFMGHRAARKQRAGKVPTSDDVRVGARKRKRGRAGAGMHELLPTNKRAKIVTKDGKIAWQAGGRLATDLSYLVDKSGDVGAHTGAMPKPVGRGSTNTKGQGEAHDRLREIDTDPSRENTNGEIYERAVKSLGTMAHGQQIMQSDRLTGGIPNLTGATPLQPPANKDKSRILLAQTMQAQREHIKQRIKTQSQHDGYTGPPPSPRRDPIQSDGSGGGYSASTSLSPPASPRRDIGGSDNFERMANLAHYLTAPGRHDFQSDSVTTKGECGGCGYPHVKEWDTSCAHCGAAV